MSPEEHRKIEELATRLVEKVKASAAERAADLTKIHKLAENQKVDPGQTKEE